MRRLVNFLVLLGLGLGLITFIPFCCAQTTVSLDSKPISIDFPEADLKDVIGILSVMTGLNIIVDNDVEGIVTARFKNVPVLQVLQTILELNDCQYEVLDDIIKVTKIPILTRSFSLKFALASEEAGLIKTLLSPEGSLKINESTNILIISDKGTNLEEIEEAIQERDSPSFQLKTRVFSFEFIRADEAASFVRDQLSEVGKVEIALPTNSLLVTDASYNLTKLEDLASSLDIFQPIKKIFTLKFALANEVVKLISDYLNSEDKIEINEEKNEIILISSSYTLGRIEEAIQEIDSPSLQLDTKVFSFKFIRADEAASLIQDQLSEVGKVEIVLPTNSLLVTDASYNLTKLEAFVLSLDIFQLLTRSFSLKFALASEEAGLIKTLLSPEGSLKINESTNILIISDKGTNLEEIEEAIQERDSPSFQLKTRVFSFEFIRADEAASFVRDQLSEVGKVEIALPTNSLLVTDASYNLTKLEDLASSLDIFQPIKKIFTLKFALANEVVKLISDYLNSEDKIEINEEKNEIILISSSYTLGRIEEAIQEIDSPSLQLDTKVFSFKFIRADEAASLIQDQLSEVGKVEIVLPTNSLLVTDTSYNFTKLEDLVSSLDISQRKEERTFTLKFALASDVKTKLVSDYLNPVDEIDADEEKNEIILTSNSYTLGRVEELLNGLDVPEKQISKKEFFVKDFKYLSLEKLAGLVRENLSSWGEIVEQDKAKNILIAKDTSYNLFKIDKFIETFISLKATETYEIKFALASEVAEVIKTFLSLEGRLDEVNDEKNTLVISDKKINLEKIAKTIQEIDSPSLQLDTKKYTLRYLTPQQVKEALQLKNILSEHGQIYVPEVKEGAGAESAGVESVKVEKDYIMIPQEEGENTEKEESQESKISLEETKEAEDNVIYITDLKKNIPNLDQAMKEIDSLSQIVTRTFFIPEGSLERIAIAIANIIGVSPEDIQGIEIGEETEWIKMKVTSPTIDLGDIGAVGKK